MRVIGNYKNDGYAQVQGLISLEVARAVMRGIKLDLGPEPLQPNSVPQHPLLFKRPTFHIYGNDYRPLSFFLWALTPAIASVVGRDILPTYDYFRIYREGDICGVHSDRPACEHSVSLTLDYSDGTAWDLEIARDRTPPTQPVTSDFGDSQFSSISMQIGDAVVYEGVHHRHGRTSPNPNAWSAHLFLHYVERGGAHEAHAFDRRMNLEPVNFAFA